jgi:hypothetical protein
VAIAKQAFDAVSWRFAEIMDLSRGSAAEHRRLPSAGAKFGKAFQQNGRCTP